jgi:class 3 adenylate cyclase
MSTVTQQGYFVIADISGYTSFVAKTELEHSHEILTELLQLLVEKFTPLMVISKLEGDAVFAYTAEGTFTRGDTLLEFLEATYVAFRDKQMSMRHKTTCTCAACQNIPALDLKFIAHCGEFIVQNIGNVRELVGSDVNLVHRLLKNHVSEATGWRAYMMFTERCLNHLQLNLENAHMQMEEYEHLGEIKTYSIDLHKRYQEIVGARRITVDEKDADVIIRVDFPTPPAIAWDWIQDPIKRNVWTRGHVHWTVGDRPQGRRGKGASNHCAHGKSLSTEVILDWRPFEYSTTDSFEGGKKTFSETIRFEPLPNGCTRVHDVMQVHMPVPRFLRRLMARYVILYQHHFDQALQEAARLARDSFSGTADPVADETSVSSLQAQTGSD